MFSHMIQKVCGVSGFHRSCDHDASYPFLEHWFQRVNDRFVKIVQIPIICSLSIKLDCEVQFYDTTKYLPQDRTVTLETRKKRHWVPAFIAFFSLHLRHLIVHAI
jgi:hypothetical protein